MVKIDEKMIQETFMNFLNNCMQAMENKGGNITISTSLEENRVKIIFEDTGHGIPPEDLQNIYNPFFTKRETGTGLGLSVAYGTIKAHDGRIKIDSIVGKGTRVTVFLKIV
jgi:two-component system NtrC family sensor kinase